MKAPILNIALLSLLTIILLSLFSLNTQAQCTGVIESDSLELVALYNALDGDNWTNNDGWLVDPVSEWTGITLTNNNCWVRRIIINNNNLSGELMEWNLPYLKEIQMYGNNISGEVPTFENSPGLEIINFYLNSLSGNLPNFNLPNLEELRIKDNNITGSIPNFDGLPNLEVLELHTNNLSGEIPDFDNIPNLKLLRLFSNELSGTIPNFSNLPILNTLHIQRNELTGSIPNFDNLPTLEYISISLNQLTGNIPNFDNLPALREFSCYTNQLTGNIPHFENCLSLEELLLSNNQLSGYIPNFNLPNLDNLWLCPNNLAGLMPDFENCPSLYMDDEDGDCLSKAKINGYIYDDTNENCIKDIDEIGLPNAKIYLEDGSALAISDSDGYYEFALDTGSYTLIYEASIEYWGQTCPPDLQSYSFNLYEYDEVVDGVNFGNESLVDCPALIIDIGTPLIRRCFENTYTLEYCNIGTKEAEDAFVEVNFPEYIIPLSSDLDYEDNGEGMLTFDLGTVEIGECQTFSIVDSVSCDAILGSTSCVSAIIHPHYKCFDVQPIWDESDLDIIGLCYEDSIQFVISNQGLDMSVPSEYKIYENDILSAVEVIQLLGGEELVINLENIGVTYRVAVEQTPNHPLYDVIQSVIEACDDEIFTFGLVTSQSEGDESSAFERDCQEIIGSYDPNDKLVTPTGIGDARCITTEDELTYKIRFQNTGNDTAFTVIVVDTINTALLDINSVTMSGSSHNYDLKIVDGNVLEWTFNNILLVDSNANETDSHGYLQFKIKQQAENPIHSIIRNEADIYFDFNAPITTPETFNQVCYTAEEFNAWEDTETYIENNAFKPNIYPNPINNYCIVELPIWELEKVRITDINGREVINKQINSTNDLKINTSKLSSGLYYIHLYGEQEYAVQKLIKH